MKKLFYLLVALIITIPAMGQELKKIVNNYGGTSEEYFVLKAHRSLKQGPYLKLFAYIFLPTYVLESGQYENNEKTGNWLSFHAEPDNSLESAGLYADSKKEGQWKYFYPYVSAVRNIFTLMGINKRTYLLDDKNSKTGKVVQFDSIGQRMMAKGMYKNDKKQGVWEYYGKSGILLNKYDYNANKLLVNNIYDEENPSLVFLGGQDRFYTLYMNLLTSNPISREEDSQVSFVLEEVNDSIVYRLTEARGNNAYKKKIVQILNALPNDWIILDSQLKKKIQITASSIRVKNESKHEFRDNVVLSVIE